MGERYGQVTDNQTFREVQSHTPFRGVDQLTYITAGGIRLGRHYFLDRADSTPLCGKLLFPYAPTLSVS